MSAPNSFAMLDIPGSPYYIRLHGLPDGDEKTAHYCIVLWAKTGEKSIMEIGKLQHLRIPRAMLDTDAGKAQILKLCGDWLTQPITVWNRTGAKFSQRHTPTHSQWLADYEMVDEFKEHITRAVALLRGQTPTEVPA